jgi:hypothetical protein
MDAGAYAAKAKPVAKAIVPMSPNIGGILVIVFSGYFGVTSEFRMFDLISSRKRLEARSRAFASAASLFLRNPSRHRENVTTKLQEALSPHIIKVYEVLGNNLFRAGIPGGGL